MKEVIGWLLGFACGERRMRRNGFKNSGITRAYKEGEVLIIPDDFCPSEDIQDAWLVVEKLRKEGTYLLIHPEKRGYAVGVWFDDGPCTSCHLFSRIKICWSGGVSRCYPKYLYGI